MENKNLYFSHSVRNSKLVKEVTNCSFLDENGNPVKGGLFDEDVFGSVDSWQKYTKSYNGCDEDWRPNCSTRKYGYCKLNFCAHLPISNDNFNHIHEYSAIALYIVPPAFRPYVKNADGSYTFHKLNYLYQKVFALEEELCNLMHLRRVTKFCRTLLDHSEAVRDLYRELQHSPTMAYLKDNIKENVEIDDNVKKIQQIYTMAFWPAGIEDNVTDIEKSALDLLLKGDNESIDNGKKRRYYYQQAVNHIEEAKTCYGIDIKPIKNLFIHCCNLFKNSKVDEKPENEE